MLINRRGLIKLAATTAGTSLLGSANHVFSELQSPIKAAVIDALVIFDPRPIFAMVNKMFPTHGGHLNRLWRSRQYEYQWLRALADQYVDYWQATEQALEFATQQLDLKLSIAKRELLMNMYLNLKPWPDVLNALTALKRADIRLALLSNMTPQMLNTNINNSRIGMYFEHIISTDQAQTYKPDSVAYQLSLDAFELSRDEIVFAAFSGWDVAGARWFGHPTFWVNRGEFKPETLQANAHGTGSTLDDLIAFIDAWQGPQQGDHVLTST